jgi:hypothetical protein
MSGLQVASLTCVSMLLLRRPIVSRLLQAMYLLCRICSCRHKKDSGCMYCCCCCSCPEHPS